MRRPRLIAGVSLVAAVVFAVMAAPAHGYVRKMTDAGIAEYWQVSCIPLTIYTYGFSDMTRDEVAKSIGAAAHTWSPSAVTCPDGTSHPFLEIVTSVADAGAKPPLPAYDGHNTVLFYSDAFPPPPESPFALTSGIVALTSVFARADGHIVDADVQVNAIPPMRWANRDPGYVAGNGQSDDAYDLQNATTHELGHMQGLGHTCWNAFSDLEQPINDMGMGVPMCDTTTDPSIADTVMFATISSPTELTKRTLSADDIRAVCEIYPSTSDPGSCGAETPNDGCGCSASGPPGPVLVLVLALVAVVVLARVRARR